MGRQSEESMRVGLEDIDVTSCLNACLVVILLTSPPPGGSVRCFGYREEGPLLLYFLEEKLVKIE